MPFTVVTLKKSPPALRGDLTKWMQEIAPGVYVGNFNTKIRERLWQRIQETVDDGEATISYACRNEIGYDFVTHKTERQVIDWEGIPLVLIPKHENDTKPLRYGFSKAAKFHKARRFAARTEPVSHERSPATYIVLDIETDGLQPTENEIIEIGVLKQCGQTQEEYQSLITYDKMLPKNISELTGISNEMLQSEGRPLKEVLLEAQKIIGDHPIVGYNIGFDIGFLNTFLRRHALPHISNRVYDLKKYVKREQPLLNNYKLQTVVDAYHIQAKVEHRALADCQVMNALAHKVKGFLEKVNENT